MVIGGNDGSHDLGPGGTQSSVSATTRATVGPWSRPGGVFAASRRGRRDPAVAEWGLHGSLMAMCGCVRSTGQNDSIDSIFDFCDQSFSVLVQPKLSTGSMLSGVPLQSLS